MCGKFMEWNSDPQDGKIKLGVQLTHIEKLINEYKKTNVKFI